MVLIATCKGRIRIFDTTLRDGDQMAGVEVSLEDKVEIAKALDELGVDIVEAGFPISSKIDFETIKAISKELSKAKVAALARASRRDVDEAAASEAHIVHVFIATSDIHLKYKLRLSREQVLEKIAETVEYAKEYGVLVLFSAEDATRSDREFLAKAYLEAVNAGSKYINIPDTVGVATPWKIVDLVRFVRSKLPKNIWVDVHCHNDFGLATANSLAGILGGADGVQVTVNGFGERAGNASLEEVVAALHYLMGYCTGVDLRKLTQTSKLVAEKFGITLQPNKPIVGLNAFAHEAGIHVHGVLSNPATYEPISPEEVGNRRRIVLGRHSGKHAVTWALKRIGVEPRDEIVNYVLEKLKEVAPRIKKVSEDQVKQWISEYYSVEGVEPPCTRFS